MNDIAIRVENLSKLYRIGQRESAYKTLRESIMNLFSRRDGKPDTIWALKDVSFEVKRGDFPHTEFISDRTISLPLSPKLTDGDVEDVICAVKRVLALK